MQAARIRVEIGRLNAHTGLQTARPEMIRNDLVPAQPGGELPASRNLTAHAGACAGWRHVKISPIAFIHSSVSAMTPTVERESHDRLNFSKLRWRLTFMS